MASTKFYVNTVSRWKREIDNTGETVTIFCPYVNQPTVRTVIHNPDRSYEVYTVFSAENFANGSSSLKALRWLLGNGVKVFHLDGLHAKLILPGNGVASVGSQNLTSRGARSFECTLVTNDHSTVRDIEQRTKAWKELAVVITLEMVEDLENLLKDLKKLFRKFKNATAEADELVLDHGK